MIANCECMKHCRIWQETEGGKYPPSDHAPSCEHFKAERFVAVAVDEDGPWCLCEPRVAEMMVKESEEPYIVKDVMLTRDQFEKLGEFDGF